jgi:tRNA(Ile)-lysidine synthase
MAWTALHATVHQTIRQRKFLKQGQAVLLGFSGGQDSMCLLQILRDLQPKWGWRVALAHCDHRWPSNSGENASYVRQLARQWELEFYSFTAASVLKGEAEGRVWRYQTFTELAHAQGFSTVLTAHTASDRAETLLYNLLRGSGMEGLQALAWQRPLSERVLLVRPLLAVTRQQTKEFCQQLSLPIWQDTMNQDLAYRRNQIRLELIPWLRQQFNPQVETALAKTAEILQAETDYLNSQTLDLLTRCSIAEVSFENHIAALDRSVLQGSPLALQRRALRHWLSDRLGIQPNYEQVEKTVALIRGHSGTRSDPFVAGIVAEVKGSWLCLIQLDN